MKKITKAVKRYLLTLRTTTRTNPVVFDHYKKIVIVSVFVFMFGVIMEQDWMVLLAFALLAFAVAIFLIAYVYIMLIDVEMLREIKTEKIHERRTDK